MDLKAFVQEDVLCDEFEKREGDKKRLKLFCEIDDVITYAVVHNGAHIIRDICVKNTSEEDIDGLIIKIDSNNELVFTTMTADMIDLKHTKARGVEAFKKSLSYGRKF